MGSYKKFNLVMEIAEVNTNPRKAFSTFWLKGEEVSSGESFCGEARGEVGGVFLTGDNLFSVLK